MTHFTQRLAALALLASTAAVPAMAASSALTSLSDSITTAVGSLSGSIKRSSDSSSKTDVAQGDYTVIEVVAVAERPGTARLTLRAVAQGTADAEFYLYLPQKTVDASQLAPGRVVTASQRPYGLAFAMADTQQAFFLVLQDEWYRELPSNPVVL